MNATDLAARLDRLPVSGFHRRVLYGLAFGFFFELADLNTFAYAAPALKKYVGISVDDIALVTSMSFLGMFLGAAVGGWVADRVGRRRALIGSIAWYSLFSLLNAATWNVPTLAGARLLTGVGLGAMTVIAITYLSETMPRAHRGRMQAATLALGLVGIPAMAFTARGVIPLGADGWRIVFVFGALGVLSLAIILRLPESPRWLLEHRGADEAEAALARIEAEVERQAGRLPAPVATAAATEGAAPHRLRELFQGRLLGRTLLLLVAWIFQTLGFYGFVSWVPTLLAEHGFDLKDSLTFSALTTIGAVPGALLAWPISDRFGRKMPTAIVAALVAVCGVLYGLSFNAAAIVVFGFAVSFFIQTFAALLYAYTPELYPTALRNTGSGFAYGTGRLANIAGPPIVALIFSTAGYIWVFVYIGICWLIVAVAITLFGPRTAAVTLEDLQTAPDTQPT
ncbi:MAG TPA: MFS transporter [Streptosporangiaceae bacterium]|jgi:putative MFS transporter